MNPYSLPPLISSILFLLIGGFCFLKNRKSLVNFTFALLCLATFWWQFSWFILFNTTSESLAVYIVKIGYTGIIFIPIVFFHFFVSFLKAKKDKWLVFLSYSLGLIFVLLLWTTNYFVNGFYKYYWGYYPRAGFLHPLHLAQLSILAIRALVLLVSHLKIQKSSPLRYNQVKYMLLALITYIPAASDYTVNYGIELYPVGFIFILVFASITTHAIVTYRLMDIAVVVTRGGVLVGTYAFIIGVPALVASVARPWLVGAMGRFWWVPPLGLFAGLALVGPFAALFLIHKIEGKQRERALRAEEHLERTAQGMIEIDSVGRLAKIIPRYLTQFYHSALDLSITHATIFLLDKDRREYVLKSTSGIRRISLDKTLPEKENSIYIWFKKIVPLIIEKRFVRRRELDVLQREDIDFWLKEERLLRLGDYIKPALIELKKLMVELRAVLCVPSYYQEGLLGFLILGEKEKGLFRPQELSLFFRLSRYAGLAIRSAQLSQDLQQAYASVAQADRLSSMGQLAASFAHEINNPVAIIISGIELSLATMREDLLKASSVEEKEKVINYTEDKLGKIKDEAFRISHIIGRIMGYVKAPMGDFTSVRLEDLIEATLGLVEHSLRKNQINVVKEIPKDLPKIRGIAGELQEVFLNLFNNALEAIKDETPGSINILARTLGNPEMVEIKVSDTGGGISPENLRKIFDFLFTTKLQGTGVGLSVSYDIIKKHDGTIDVESEMGKGTTFTIRLPIWKEEGVIKR